MITIEDVLLRGKHDLFVVATGAGTNLLTCLWAIPGASAFLRGFQFPYDSAETDAFLGYKPEHYCDEKAAVLLAMEAYVRARRHYYLRGDHLKPETVDNKAIGLALTASVASKSEHRGEHRSYVSTVSNFIVPTCTAKKTVLEKGVGKFARISDDLIVSRHALDEISGILIDGSYSPSSFSDDDVKEMIFESPYPLAGSVRESVRTDKIVYIPGNFNPLHVSHRMIGLMLKYHYGLTPIYTVCIDPPHKPALSLIDMLDRIAMFRALAPGFGLLFTREDPLFVDKMNAYPNSSWAVGADTLDRLLDPKWGPSTDEVCGVIEQTSSKIFFFPTKDGDGWIDTPSIMTKYRSDKLAGLLRTNIFRVNEELPVIRSTDIRAAAGR